jgi:2-isopropylmalate synthase
MVRVSHAIAEIANIAPDTHQAYVGSSAFAHKAGLHASAIKVDPVLYNHIDPVVVGNDMRILVTEMAGRASIELKSRELGLDLTGHPEALTRVTTRVKELEARGWSFEAADASFELLVRTELADGALPRPFALESYRVLVEHREDGAVVSEATVKVRVRGQRVIATAEGNGPVNALDEALRVALTEHYPELVRFELADYKVRILEGSHGTGAVTRVLVETRSTGEDWTTVGVHENVVEASWQALVDALSFGLSHQVRFSGSVGQGGPARASGGAAGQPHQLPVCRVPRITGTCSACTPPAPPRPARTSTRRPGSARCWCRSGSPCSR